MHNSNYHTENKQHQDHKYTMKDIVYALKSNENDDGNCIV